MTALLKIGGSILTEKSQVFSTCVDNMAVLATDIRISRVIPIVVHGTGSSGKAFARHYSCPGYRSTDATVFQMTIGQIRRLQEKLLSAFCNAGVPCCPLSTNALFFRHKGKLEMYTANPIRHLLTCGVIPILCGDILVEESGRYGIVSSDAIVEAVARTIKIEDCVFATDVDGVLGEHDHMLAKLSTNCDLCFDDSDRSDVTGGMRAKFRVALEIASYGTRTTIVNGQVPGRIRDALTRRPVVGTRVMAVDTSEERGRA